jgi:rhamnosyltransferase
MPKKIFGSSVASVTVTYNPDPKILQKQLDQVSTQVGRVFLIDNGSSNAEEIKGIAKSIAHTRVILCHANLGLGHAQNLGIQACRDEGMAMVLLLDQDSVPRTSMVEALLTAFNQLTQANKKVAAVGACYTGSHTGHLSFFVQFKRFRFRKCFCDHTESDQIVPADMLISSGSLIPIPALDTIGEMDEGLFIDHIDTDWFLRAKSFGWQSYGVCDALMEHTLGEQTLRIWWGRWRYLPLHQPFRYYYIYRNSLLLYQRKYPDRLWKQTDIIRLIMTLLFCLSLNRKWENLRMIFHGLKDGISGSTGPLKIDKVISQKNSI